MRGGRGGQGVEGGRVVFLKLCGQYLVNDPPRACWLGSFSGPRNMLCKCLLSDVSLFNHVNSLSLFLRGCISSRNIRPNI